MGCDMHISVEAFDDKTEEWVPIVLCHPMRRKYRFFSKLAGVRGTDEANSIAGYRGLPGDVSLPVKKILGNEYDSDFHSESWCTLEEFKQAVYATNYSFEISYPYFIFHNYEEDSCFYEYFPQWASQIRFIFWFDN